ncbi:RND efflux system, outer membrane lipoprotein, NodT, partial [Pseudomonas syringae pv. pisi str. 1704B]
GAWQRAQYENAIAVLMGMAPADFNLPATTSIPQ